MNSNMAREKLKTDDLEHYNNRLIEIYADNCALDPEKEREIKLPNLTAIEISKGSTPEIKEGEIYLFMAHYQSLHNLLVDYIGWAQMNIEFDLFVDEADRFCLKADKEEFTRADFEKHISDHLRFRFSGDPTDLGSLLSDHLKTVHKKNNREFTAKFTDGTEAELIKSAFGKKGNIAFSTVNIFSYDDIDRANFEIKSYVDTDDWYCEDDDLYVMKTKDEKYVNLVDIQDH